MSRSEIYTKILFIGLCVNLASLLGATVWAQTTANLSSTTNPRIIEQITQETPIASDKDLEQTKTLFGGTAAAIGTGLVAEFFSRRKKTKKIDNALRGTDYDLMDLQKAHRLFFVAAKKPENKAKTTDQILDLPAFPENDLSNTTIGQAIDNAYSAYENWFVNRYRDNPE